MKYEDARKLIRTGDVLTFSGSWFFSKLIRWWTDQPVSHVGLAIWLKGRLCILESLESHGVRIVPLSVVMPQYLATGHKVFWQSLIAGCGEQVADHAISKWGTEYASWRTFLAIISPTYRKFWERFRKPGNGVTCSELVAHAFYECGMRSEKPEWLMTPGDFHSSPFLSTPEELT